MPDSLSTQNGPERSVILCLPKDVMSSPLSGINYIPEGKKKKKKREKKESMIKGGEKFLIQLCQAGGGSHFRFK